MDFITSREALRAHYKPAHEGSLKKEMRGLDVHSRKFLANSPFVLIGTSDDNGNADVTPKGDKPGFVLALDDVTLAIPDRPGNNRLDTIENLMVNPAIGLLFLIPGMDETLRINGEARVTIDGALRERLAVEGKPPLSVIIVKARSVYMHCAKAFMRSQLWHPESWQPRSAMPTLGQILKDQTAFAETAEAKDRWLDEVYKEEMW
jgi:PPOX class probable FMN-dependent enzyme